MLGEDFPVGFAIPLRLARSTGMRRAKLLEILKSSRSDGRSGWKVKVKVVGESQQAEFRRTLK